MRRRLNTALVSGDGAASEPRAIARERGRSSRNQCVFAGARKEKPGGGNAGSDFFVIGVYGFKYAAWLLLVAPESAERLVVIVQPTFFSCSSTFLFFSNVSNLTEPFAISHRFLSVCALTRPWVGTTYIKQDTCHGDKKQHKTASIRATYRAPTDSAFGDAPVKAIDSAVSSASRVFSEWRDVTAVSHGCANFTASRVLGVDPRLARKAA